MKTIELKHITKLLEEWLRTEDKTIRKSISDRISESVGNREVTNCTNNQREWLLDLVVDLAYFSINENHLKEEPTLRSDKQIEPDVKKTLSNILGDATHA